MHRLALLALVASCSSGGKQAAPPQTPEPAPPATPEPTPVAKPEPPPPPPDTGGFRLVPSQSLKYVALDPANPGPEIATVTGDLQQGGAFFLKFPPGAKPGLHTHSSDYHAIVISGAPKHWLAGQEKKAQVLGAGSYWFQPGNQPHGDECTGTEPCILYLVIAGKFDMTPTPKAKAGKPDKYLLVARKDVKFKPFDPKQPDGPKLGLVSGDPKTGPVAFIIELPAGAKGGLHGHTSDYHALVLDGAPAHWLPHQVDQGEALAPGTYWFQPGGYDHGDRCTSDVPCHTFVMMGKPLDVLPPKQK